jgi:hypothetical protein
MILLYLALHIDPFAFVLDVQAPCELGNIPAHKMN